MHTQPQDSIHSISYLGVSIYYWESYWYKKAVYK